MSSEFPRYRTDRIVDSAEAAVALAVEWRDSGRYDWFRGQSKPWALISSMGRLGEAGRESGRERLIQFATWVANMEGLKNLRDNADATFAVSQHYGLPTDFIDFTSDINVAAFFATHGRNQTVGEYACLLCIDSQDYVETVNLHAEVQELPKVQAVSLHVPDLWRIQTQCGFFLEMPYGNIEEYYPTQRILFPFRSPWPRPAEDHIYPSRKSHLELQLDHYFEWERLRRVHLETMEWLETLRAEGRRIRTVNLREPTGYLPSCVDAEKVRQLPRWPSQAVKAWLHPPDEVWDDVNQYATVSIALPESSPGLEEALLTIMMAAIGQEPDLRQKLCQFRILSAPDTFPLAERERLQALCTHLWDGMRNLPYSLEQIGRALSRTLWLELTIDRQRLYGGREWYGVFEPVIPDLQKVGLSMPDGTGGSAFLPRPSLRGGLRTEVADLLLPERKHFIDRPAQLLQAITAPEILFELDVLAGLFAEHLLPTQAVVHGFDQPLIFNPVSLMVFGAP